MPKCTAKIPLCRVFLEKCTKKALRLHLLVNSRWEKNVCCALRNKTHDKKIFVVRFFLVHAKEFVCRAFFCHVPYKNTRQTISLPCARNKTHGKEFDALQM
jgi:hypothetical protein